MIDEENKNVANFSSAFLMAQSFNGIHVYSVCNFDTRNAEVRETNH